ncbi:hypothetical protein JRQ81_000776 [Phrynocephalus forsythii]|uniref:Nucleolar and spindle-associated protein 1 n=1 Tax=Phrynocephalus forsythii TaxID=171643 RepID=A0A9Q0Y786_9SAUR|nr:hypothetical protein JRQ81_000776 [Phrynocephalus forsythii]
MPCERRGVRRESARLRACSPAPPTVGGERLIFGLPPVMEVPLPEQLETLKYSELQRLAKTLGLKANLKADKLLNLLKQHVNEPKWETRSMDIKRASFSIDYEECDSSQTPVNLVMFTNKCQKLNCKNAQEHPDTGNNSGENAELFLKEEIVTELNENERFLDAGSRKTQDRNQNEYQTNGRMSGNLAENSATPRNQKEKNCTMHKRVESKTAVDYIPGTGYPGSLSGSKRRRINSGTPDFRKLHEAQFKKMQSIDDYMEKKNKRLHNFSNSVSKAKTCSSGVLLSPHPQNPMLSATCTPRNLRHTPQNSRIVDKNTSSKKTVFSTGFSANKMNVRFSESTKDNEHKRSLTKTPSRKSPFPNSCTPGSQKNNKAATRRKCTGAAAKRPVTEAPAGVIPSQVIPETKPPLSKKKPMFDLQASLSRPLNYQPHRGKLKPWGKSKENHQSVCSHRRNYKQPLLQSREERREKHAQGRRQRKDQVLETRRGLAVI